ncbi:MAG: transglycosylase SLT domain-containing protein [Dissulfurispiraceae bacterium]|nr:transglycosylase SLT domain-containing protein [Dissulfurispiraceae bacterium]
MLLISYLFIFVFLSVSASADDQTEIWLQLPKTEQPVSVIAESNHRLELSESRDMIGSFQSDIPVLKQEASEDKSSDNPTPVSERSEKRRARMKSEAKPEEAGYVPQAEAEQFPDQPVIKQVEASQQLPLSMSYPQNEKGVKAIDRSFVLFKETMKERFSMWLERSAKYIEIMKGVLKERRMPDELVFLPLIESGFNINAYSRARAVGPWQFISGTAKRYGLVIDWWRDERKDPVKSTRAAADYLTDLYRMFGSWKLALAAYNAGEGRVARTLRKNNATDYWELLYKNKLPAETRDYVPRFIAAATIANTPEDHGFSGLDFHQPMDFDEVVLERPVDLQVIAACADTTVKEIRELNPELRRWSTPPNLQNYTVRIPAGTRDLFMDNFAEVPEEELFSVQKYVVKKGDTIKKVSRKTATPVQVLLAMNALSGIERLKTGDMLLLPPDGKYAPDLDDRMAAKKKTVRTAAKSKKKSVAKKSLVSDKKPVKKTSRSKGRTKKI